MPRAHLFVDVSAHGFGHLAQVAPVLTALVARLPELRVTLRSALPQQRLSARLAFPFEHLPGSSDFGYLMRDATRVDLAATARAYKEQHAGWPQRVAQEARLLAALAPDLVLTDVAYLPLAASAQAGIPSVAMSSLNWADLFAHFYGHLDWAAAILREMVEAYQCAEFFLRLTPGMEMASLPQIRDVGPIGALGKDCRDVLRRRIGCAPGERLVLLAFGGVDYRLPVAGWPTHNGLHWLLPRAWNAAHPGAMAIESLARPFADLVRSVDAVVTKPGYGTFAEAACNGTAVLYVRRDDWPEQESLITWLHAHARCREVSEEQLLRGELAAPLAALWQQPFPTHRPTPVGTEQAAEALLPCLLGERVGRSRG